MSKAGAVLALVGVASFGIAYHVSRDLLLGPGEPFSAQLDIVNDASDPRAQGDGKHGIAPEGWRTFARTLDSRATGSLAAPFAAGPTASAVNATPAPRGDEVGVHGLSRGPHDRASLVRDLQRELKRVGCYDAEISGVWTAATRNAMTAFTLRINAELPVQEPDNILLALVQGQKDKACGMPCPVGQGLAADGRCLPAAILTLVKRLPTPALAAAAAAEHPRPAPVITGWSATTIAAPLAAPPEGRMGLAGPDATPTATAAVAAGAQDVPKSAAVQKHDVPKHVAFGTNFFRQLDRMSNH